jgi:hypothetical protein
VQQLALVSGNAADPRQPVIACCVPPGAKGLLVWGWLARVSRADLLGPDQVVVPPAVVDEFLPTAPRIALSWEHQIDRPLWELHA